MDYRRVDVQNINLGILHNRVFLLESQANILSAQRVHQGHVLSVAHSQDSRWLLSGGGSGQLLLWDLTNFSTFSPGKPNYPDQVGEFQQSKSYH